MADSGVGQPTRGEVAWQFAPGKARLCLHPDGQLSVESASPDKLRAALAWLPCIRERHLTAARLTGHARLSGAAPAGVRWPGQQRRTATADLYFSGPIQQRFGQQPSGEQPSGEAGLGSAEASVNTASINTAAPRDKRHPRMQPVYLTLRWPSAQAAMPPPKALAASPVATPAPMLGWLALPLPDALAAVVAFWQAQGTGAQVHLSDGVMLHTARNAAYEAALDGSEAHHFSELIYAPDGTPIGCLSVRNPLAAAGTKTAVSSAEPEPWAALPVLALLAAQARAQCQAERRDRAAHLSSVLHRDLLALATHDAPPDAPLHSAMRLVGARGAALITVQRAEPSSTPDSQRPAQAFCPVQLGTLSPANLDGLIGSVLVRRLAAGHDPTPFVLAFGRSAARQATLVVPLRAAGPLAGAWVFQCPYWPSHPNPDAWKALLEAAQHPAHLQSLLGDLPGSGSDGHLTALSLLRSLGETDIPYTLAQRGLTHLTSRTGAQSGTYLTVQTTRGSEGGAADLTSIVQVGQEQLTVPQGMLQSVASGGEQLLLSAPHPMLPLPLTSALLTPIFSSGRTTGVLALLDTREGASPAPETPGLLALLAQRVGSAAERYVALRTLAHTREQAFRVLGTVLEYRSYETKGHTDRVTELALKLGLYLDLDFSQLTHLRWGAYLHDLGKIAIPDAVLLKTGPLTVRERELMHQHVTIGEQMLREQEFVPPEVLSVVRHHHERWDGHGYPDGLAQHNIPMLARLFAVVDVYDALTSERPYKKSWTQNDALFEMRRMAGTHLDPDILEQFEGVLRSLDDGSARADSAELDS
ncbi:HD-GYP domain-containing protein [Deinococcus sp. QL22]|uniref:HD-GYP domain-containing protein n=1 Tax=Deinococcus sp. QL22 TaxID=2939437 RepID=UPI00201747A7|nr:HD-GYP domain-containing protein [Deinococcus sp. QL22]UQN05570.1 HD-GYP domain-containing protein [Deinococcus sp. QL22]